MLGGYPLESDTAHRHSLLNSYAFPFILRLPYNSHQTGDE
jgi:hypothetical protein